MVSIRTLATALGATVAWEDATKTVRLATPLLREVKGEWETMYMPATEGGAFPVQATIRVNQVYPTGEVASTVHMLGDTFGCAYWEYPGRPVPFQITIVNVTGAPGSEQPATAVQLDSYAPAVAICAVDPKTGDERTVWQGYFVDGPNYLAPYQGAICTFWWDQKDAAGQQVPPGPYLVKFLPFSMSVREGSKSYQYCVSSSSSDPLCRVLIEDFYYVAPPPLAVRRGEPVRVLVNGTALPADLTQGSDGDLLVPIRAVTDAVGGSVCWDEATRTAYVAIPPLKEMKGGWETQLYPVPMPRMEPVQVQVDVDTRDSSLLRRPEIDQLSADLGQPIRFSVWIWNTTGSYGIPRAPVSLQAYAPVVAIYAIDRGGYGWWPEPKDKHLVWQAYFVGGPSYLGPDQGANFTFSWDQKDAAGRQVPPGKYVVEFVPFYVCANGGGAICQGKIESRTIPTSFFDILDRGH